ncbi:MAG: hypothetical protein US25_C0046G0003 [Candidatus Moranbacteria bacterium GW2011_GWE1_36_7]|nr:MAG: hypothetical protein UR99_C0051G0003 [Candidatus Moranbacteria bacterium GW2011_GWD2_36_12]KKQ04790.1 MAG: hypothetical protein US16_C0047G0003 [Candidatus Moranbacteria bacterium GW2011_GWE2_36_40]KKQ12730.1 MAG: hypothetical protein US25_C0046G0003 [Candidatus Moranbacteria bacterium GW2011_GWE1_36_7]
MLPNFAWAAPSIFSTVGTISDGQNVIINGNEFGTKAIAASFYYNNLENDTIGQIPAGQATNISKFGTTQANLSYSGSKSLEFDYCSDSKSDWSASDIYEVGDFVYYAPNYTTYTVISDVGPSAITPNLDGVHYQSGLINPHCSNGEVKEDWQRNAIDLGSDGADKVYVSAWVYLNKGSSTSETWQWKGIANINSQSSMYYDLSTTYPSSIWIDSRAYSAGRYVTYGGNTYGCILSVSAPGPNPSPDLDATHWAFYAPGNPLGNAQAYEETDVHTGSWWDEPMQRWFNPAAAVYYFDYATQNIMHGVTPLPGRPADSYLWNQWQRLEFYAQRASAPLAADGIWNEKRIGKSEYNFNITNAITHEAGNNPWRYAILSHAIASVVDGYVDFKVYMDDIYVDKTQARVEICDSSTWSARSHCEIQIPTVWSDASATVSVNQGSFADGATAYLYMVDENGNMNANGYPISFIADADAVAPNPPTGLGVL